MHRRGQGQQGRQVVEAQDQVVRGGKAGQFALGLPPAPQRGLAPDDGDVARQALELVARARVEECRYRPAPPVGIEQVAEQHQATTASDIGRVEHRRLNQFHLPNAASLSLMLTLGPKRAKV